MVRKLRILLLTSNYGRGGAQRVFYEHAKEFNRYAEVEEGVFDLVATPRVYDTGLPAHQLQRDDLLTKAGPIGRLISRALALRKLTKLRGYDLVISHMDGANWINALSFSHAKKIMVVHGSVLGDRAASWKVRIFRRLIAFRLLYPLANRVVAVSSALRRELEREGLQNVTTINNWFNISAIRQDAVEEIAPEHAKVFKRQHVLVTAGRLVEQKQHAVLLPILAELKRQGQDVCLVVLGDGELRETLRLRCQSLGLKVGLVCSSDSLAEEDADVYFLGHLDNPFPIISRSSLFLFPSAWEGFPLALCEAMACGSVVLSADCPTGPREILSPKDRGNTRDTKLPEITPCGVLLPIVRDEIDRHIWVRIISHMLDNTSLRSEISADATFRMRDFDREIILQHWLSLVKEVCSRSSLTQWSS